MTTTEPESEDAVEMSNDEREARILELFNDQWAKDGEIEEDQGTVSRSDLKPCPGDSSLVLIPVVSEGDDNGAYVRAWVWVDFDGTDLDKPDEEDDDES